LVTGIRVAAEGLLGKRGMGNMWEEGGRTLRYPEKKEKNRVQVLERAFSLNEGRKERGKDVGKVGKRPLLKGGGGPKLRG